jgi:hypothetical protein
VAQLVTATLDGMADTLTLDELIAALKRLKRMRGAERIAEARRLSPIARASTSADANAETYRVTRSESPDYMTQPALAAALDVPKENVERAIAEHRLTLRSAASSSGVVSAE